MGKIMNIKITHVKAKRRMQYVKRNFARIGLIKGWPSIHSGRI